MIYAHMSEHEQLDTQISMPKGQAIAGNAIGIIVLDLCYPLLPGNVANASTYHFPVLFKVLKGATISQILKADSAVLDLIVEGGRELEKQGVRAVVGACGYLANYQEKVAAALDVPVFLSSLLQVPMITRALTPEQKIGIICSDAAALTPNTLAACGIDDLSRIAIAGAQDLPEFENITLSTGHFNSYKLQEELVSLAKQFVSNNPKVGSLLLECSDMPPYAWAIQNAVKLPVFDFTTLINWIYTGVVRHQFAGFM